MALFTSGTVEKAPYSSHPDGGATRSAAKKRRRRQNIADIGDERPREARQHVKEWLPFGHTSDKAIKYHAIDMPKQQLTSHLTLNTNQVK